MDNFSRWGFRLYSVALIVLVSLPTPAISQNIQWIRQFRFIVDTSAKAVAADATGIYVAGRTGGIVVPDAFLRKYDANGNELWTRRFGTATATGVAVDAGGVYVVGDTNGALPGQTSTGGGDAFVRKYDANGNELWTRQFGTSYSVRATGVAVGTSGVYVVGTTSEALPGQISAGSYDIFVRKYDPNGNAVWTRQFGTSAVDEATGVTVDSTGVYVVGETLGTLAGQTPNAGSLDAFVRKYDANGSIVWTRQFGTASADWGARVAGDTSGVYVVGTTFGTLPGQTPSSAGTDAFVRKYHISETELWTRQFGTSDYDWAEGVALDSTGAYVVGATLGILPGQTPNAGSLDAFVRKYDANGSIVWTRQFGTSSSDSASAVALDSTGVYVVGETFGTLSGQTNIFGKNAFVVKMTVSPPPSPAVNDGGVVNNSSFAPHPAPLAPGSIATIFGSNLNDGSTVLFSSFGPDGKLVTSLGGASVTINNIPAPMFYSTPGQLGIQIPFELTGQTAATIRVTVSEKASPPRTVFLDSVAPGIFTVNTQGTGAVAALHQDGATLVTTENPAQPGEAVVLYATGLGPVTPPLATGTASTGNRTVATPTVTFDGIPREVQFSGTAPGFVGLNQINVRIPSSTRSASNIPVVLSIGGKQSNSVTIAVAP